MEYPIYNLPGEGEAKGKYKLGLLTRNGNPARGSITIQTIEDASAVAAFAKAAYERGRQDHASEIQTLLNEGKR